MLCPDCKIDTYNGMTHTNLCSVGALGMQYLNNRATARYYRELFLAEFKARAVAYLQMAASVYPHEDAIRTADGRWPGWKVIPLEDAVQTIKDMQV